MCIHHEGSLFSFANIISFFEGAAILVMGSFKNDVTRGEGYGVSENVAMGHSFFVQ